MPFIPPSPSPTESKRLFTSVSLLLSRIQGYRYHLSKFRIYSLVYCIAWGWGTETTQRDGMGREEEGGFRMGSTCTPVVDSC